MMTKRPITLRLRGSVPRRVLPPSLWPVSPVGSALTVLLVLAVLALGGCLTSGPMIPRPEIVYVPHPDRVPSDLTAEELLEFYAASPNRNPDGLGVLPTVWLQSRMMLVVREVQIDHERRNKLAYARSDEEQAAALRKQEQYFRERVLFEGWFIGDSIGAVQPEWYLQEGVYLIDDRGRKFLPLAVGNQVDPSYYKLIKKLKWEQGVVIIPESYPRIEFPKSAITPQTKAVTLYFAALYRRMSFTWVFDPDYVPAASAAGPSLDRGVPGIWNR